jgi:outer membrane immunogenic protein
MELIMMNRKIAVSIALALGLPFAGASYAATPFAGPYVGAQIGYSVYDIQNTFGGFSVEGLSASGAEGGVYGGWGMKFAPNYYAGIEAEYNWSGAEHTETGGFQIQDNDNYGISGRLGWMPSSNVMLYGRLGWQRATLEYDYGGVITSEQDHDGFRFGLGAEVAMTSNWLMRMDYAHTTYDDVTVNIGISDNFEPDNDVFRVGAAYQF